MTGDNDTATLPTPTSTDDVKTTDETEAVATIYLIRHGQTDWNVAHRIQGGEDIELNDEGLAQAEITARALAKVPNVAAIYSSDLKRAHVTAEHVARHHKAHIRPHKMLRERHYGIFQGKTWTEIRHAHPEHLKQLEADPEYVVPAGESLGMAHRRVKHCLHEIATAHRGETVIVVAHAGILSQVWRAIHNIPLTEPEGLPASGLPNCGINCVQHMADGSWRVVTWGDVAHLKDDASTTVAAVDHK